jgi:hypothetical protein
LESKDVLIGDDGYIACFDDSEAGREGLWYPNDNANTAYVQQAVNGRTTTLVHFLLDDDPSYVLRPVAISPPS